MIRRDRLSLRVCTSFSLPPSLSLSLIHAHWHSLHISLRAQPGGWPPHILSNHSLVFLPVTWVQHVTFLIIPGTDPRGSQNFELKRKKNSLHPLFALRLSLAHPLLSWQPATEPPKGFASAQCWGLDLKVRTAMVAQCKENQTTLREAHH